MRSGPWLIGRLEDIWAEAVGEREQMGESERGRTEKKKILKISESESALPMGHCRNVRTKKIKCEKKAEFRCLPSSPDLQPCDCKNAGENPASLFDSLSISKKKKKGLGARTRSEYIYGDGRQRGPRRVPMWPKLDQR